MKNAVILPVMDDPSAFRQQIRMSAVQVAGLKPSELEIALAYEVEPSSGIPASEAELEYRAVVDVDPTVRVYDVAVRHRVARNASRGERYLKPLMAAGIIILLLVSADAVLTFMQESGLKKDVAVRERLNAQVVAVRREAQSKRDEARAVRGQREAAAKAQDDVARFRSALPDLLHAIAAECGERAVLKEIASEKPFRLKMTATAVSAKAAADVMVGLSAAAARSKWNFHPGTTVASATGATVTFDCEFTYD